MKDILTDKQVDRAAAWSTSSFGFAADTSPRELAALSAHMRRCAAERGAWFSVMSAAESLNRLAAPRLVTIMVLFTLMSILASLVI